MSYVIVIIIIRKVNVHFFKEIDTENCRAKILPVCNLLLNTCTKNKKDNTNVAYFNLLNTVMDMKEFTVCSSALLRLFEHFRNKMNCIFNSFMDGYLLAELCFFLTVVMPGTFFLDSKRASEV